jgi:hypothetical protein
MTFKKLALVALATGALGMAAPANAWGWNWGGSTSGWGGSTSGGHSSTSGGHSSTSGGHTTTSSGGTAVPEPGMLGMFGLGLVAIGFARTRRRNG